MKYYLGKASQHQVLLVLNATRIPDIRGACNITPAQSYLDAKSTVGTVPLNKKKIKLIVKLNKLCLNLPID